MGDKRKVETKKIAVAGTCAAISAVAIIIANFAPLSFSVLLVASVCYLTAFERCGLMYGVLTIGASILISFFTNPLSGAFFLVIILFAPYSFIAYLMRKLRYNVVKECILRVFIATAVGILAFVALFHLAGSLFSLDLSRVFGTLGYAGFGAIFVVVFIATDFMINQLSIRIRKIVK